MKPKWLLLLSLIMLLNYSCVGQQVRSSKQANATFNNFCLADSIKQTLSELQHKADAIMTFQYYYDNGVPESATMFWQMGEKTFAKTFQNCKPSSVPITYLRPDTLFTFYRQQHIADLSKMALPLNTPSHGMTYFVGVYLPGKTRFYKIMESQRHRIDFSNNSNTLPGETPVNTKEDPRSIWLDLYEQVIK